MYGIDVHVYVIRFTIVYFNLLHIKHTQQTPLIFIAFIAKLSHLIFKYKNNDF